MDAEGRNLLGIILNQKSKMKQIQFQITQDNGTTHQQVKALMRQQRILDVRIDKAFASISCQRISGIQYMLNPDTWAWLLKYLRTGDNEDFGIVPSNVSVADSDFQIDIITQLIEQGCNIAIVPFLIETDAYIKLRALFRYGKLFFRIRINDEFMNFLSAKGLWLK